MINTFRVLVAGIGLLYNFGVYAQSQTTENPSVESSLVSKPNFYNEQKRIWQVGVGGLVLRDTYLSPLKYGGYTLSLITERSRYGYETRSILNHLVANPWRKPDYRWLHHETLSFDYGHALNPTLSASIRRLQFRWDRSLSYRTLQTEYGVLYLGAGVTAGIGGLYHSRNGNNPATGKLDLSLTFNASYSYQLPSRSFPARISLYNRLDLLGVAFAQGFGENYYELYQHSPNLLKRIYPTYPLNNLSNQIRIRIDLPLGDWAIVSVGYRFQNRWWKLNQIENLQRDHTVYLGLVSYIKPIGGRTILNRNTVPLPF